jgi:hypothetical protein
MFSSIVHRLAHEMKYEWIKDCQINGKTCKYQQGELLLNETIYQARQKQKPDRLDTHDTTWANDLKEEELF